MSFKHLLVAGLLCPLIAIAPGTAVAQQSTPAAPGQMSRPPAVAPDAAQKAGADAEFCPPVEAGMQQMFSMMGAMSEAMQQAAKVVQPTAPLEKRAN